MKTKIKFHKKITKTLQNTIENTKREKENKIKIIIYLQQ